MPRHRRLPDRLQFGVVRSILIECPSFMLFTLHTTRFSDTHPANPIVRFNSTSHDCSNSSLGVCMPSSSSSICYSSSSCAPGTSCDNTLGSSGSCIPSSPLGGACVADYYYSSSVYKFTRGSCSAGAVCYNSTSIPKHWHLRGAKCLAEWFYICHPNRPLFQCCTGWHGALCEWASGAPSRRIWSPR